MSQALPDQIEAKHYLKDKAEFGVGDTVRVHTRGLTLRRFELRSGLLIVVQFWVGCAHFNNPYGTPGESRVKLQYFPDWPMRGNRGSIRTMRMKLRP